MSTASEFLRTCRERILKGEAKYGPVRSDPRNRSREAMEEAYDIQNYIDPILMAKFPQLRNHPARINAIYYNFQTYKCLLELEKAEKELEQTEKKGG